MKLPLLTRISTVLLLMVCAGSMAGQESIPIEGRVVDAKTGEVLPARLYIESATGEFFHAESKSTRGTAIPYSKIRPNGSIEVHTTLSAHPFTAKLPPGSYTLTAERGKEYSAASRTINIDPGMKAHAVILELKRWINMAERGW
ncbi:MAG: hypothetical protein KJT03_20355, partial [Verrucomicrobiae bacterium]|nr:hypothetical protein [Verrucomicrobiae bacterium]